MIDYFLPKYSNLAIIMLIALLGAIVQLFLKHDRKLNNYFFILTLSIIVLYVFSLFREHIKGLNHSYKLLQLTKDLIISFNVETLGISFALLVSVMSLIAGIFTIGYNNAVSMQKAYKFYFWILLSIFAAFGIAFASNLITMFVFYELLSFSTFPLVYHYKYDNVRKAAISYLATLVSLSMLFFLPAIIIINLSYNSTSFVEGGMISHKLSKEVVSLLLIMFLFGIAKTAIMPFHFWLPRAMVAPIPVSALLHAVTVVKAGIFCLAKILIYIFGLRNLHHIYGQNHLTNPIFLIAAITVLLASLIAIKQKEIKAMLAYSTISQLSICILPLSLFTKEGIIVSFLQVFTHSFSKIALFFTAGIIYTFYGRTKLEETKGLYKSNIFLSILLMISALSLIGIPPFAGFFSKYMILKISLLYNNYYIFIIILLSTLITAFYMGKWLKLYFSEGNSLEASQTIARNDKYNMVIATTLASLLTLGFIFAQKYAFSFLDTIRL